MAINTNGQANHIIDLTTFPSHPQYGVNGSYSWTGNAGQAAGTINYSFTPSLSYYGTNQTNTALTAGSQGFVTDALNAWEQFINVTFTENNTNSKIVFSEVPDISGSQGAKAEPYVINNSDLERVDIFLTQNLPAQAVGGAGYQTILHEIGHSLGLSHPGGSASNSNYDSDSTIMSYNSGAQVTNPATALGTHAITPMIHDIAATQFLYGANYNTRIYDDLYTLDGTKQAWTIWDADGEDTLRVGVNETRNAVLDLRGGLDENDNPYWSSVGDEYVAIALDAGNTNTGTVDIENAVGGLGDDLIIGNDLDNTITGNGGNDTLDGGLGNDRYVFDSTSYLTATQDTLVTIQDSDGIFEIDFGAGLGRSFENKMAIGAYSYEQSWGIIDQITANNPGPHTPNWVPYNIVYKLEYDERSGEPDGDVMGIYVHDGTHTALYAFFNPHALDEMWFEFPYFTGVSNYKEVVDIKVDNQAALADMTIRDLINSDMLTINTNDHIWSFDLSSFMNSSSPPAGQSEAGSSGADSITTGAGDDTIWGNDGDDTVTSGEGNDTIYGGNGHDYLLGNAGDDYVAGDSGNDTVFGDEGNDTVTGNDGDDVVYGSDGNDIVDGGSGNDFVTGDAGNDYVLGNNGDDQVYGYTGQDSLFGQDGNDTLQGQDDNDYVDGGIGNDGLYGGNGDDVIYGQDGADWIQGDAGADAIVGGLGADGLIGGAGDDIFSYHTVTDSTAAQTDWIHDFTAGNDQLDLSQIATGVSVIGSANFTGNVGSAELRYDHAWGNTIVQLDADGDTLVDLQMVMVGSVSLSANELLYN